MKTIFDNLEEKEIEKITKRLEFEKLKLKKGEKVNWRDSFFNHLVILIKGNIEIIKYDYNGNRTIIDTLEKNDLFGNIFENYESDIILFPIEESEILFIDIELLFKKNKNIVLANNIIELLRNKMSKINIKLEILSKRSIRDKLISYFKSEQMKINKKSIFLKITYTDLADYLSVDRSAMMRELKKMKEEKIIKVIDKKITVLI